MGRKLNGRAGAVGEAWDAGAIRVSAARPPKDTDAALPARGADGRRAGG